MFRQLILLLVLISPHVIQKEQRKITLENQEAHSAFKMEIKLYKLTLFPKSKSLFCKSQLLPKVLFEVNEENKELLSGGSCSPMTAI